MYSEYERLRDERGLRDSQVSKATGIPQPTLSEWKNGRYKPKVEKLQKLAVFFGVPLETFLA